MQDRKPRIVSQDPENIKKIVKEHSNNLAKLGTELGEIQFSYKIEENSTKEYWQQRIKEFIKYNEKGAEYYNQVYNIMNLVNKQGAQLFLLRISKFRQLSKTVIENMEKVSENPSIVNSKDKQQSKWSKEIKNQLTEQSNKCLRHEMDMNSTFREFYEKELKKILE